MTDEIEDHGRVSDRREDPAQRGVPTWNRRTVVASAVAGATGLGAITGPATGARVGSIRAGGEVRTTDQTPSGSATFGGGNGDYRISAAGHDVWRDADEYGAIYYSDVRNLVAETAVRRQEATNDWAKAGLMMGDDLTAGGSSAGDVVVGVTPANGFLMDWDADGDGYMDEHVGDGTTTYPCRLRLKRFGSQFTGAYSTDGGSTWTTLATVPAPTTRQDLGLFATSHVRGTTSTVEFEEFETTTLRLDRKAVDTTPSGSATFIGGRGGYTVSAAGHDVWRDADEYAAVYERPTDAVLVETTVVSQEDTFEWAKAGLMLARDITAPGSSAGDVVAGVTPGRGVFFDWDADGDGLVDTHTSDGPTQYPCTLRVVGRDGRYVGEYSTDRGKTWREIGRVNGLPGGDRDVGAFVTSHVRGTRSTVDFDQFDVLDGLDRPTVDATPSGDTLFGEREGRYVISAGGHDVWRDADAYGAIYEPNVPGDLRAWARIPTQRRIHEWSKAGLMLAEDITAPGSSAGDVVAGVTPDHGFLFDRDANGDGFLDTHVGKGTAQYPCTIYVERAGDSVGSWAELPTGESVTLGSYLLSDPPDALDVGVFATSHEEGERSTVVFEPFNVDPNPY